MPYIQGSKIDGQFKGSLEHKALLIRDAIVEHFGESRVSVLATHSNHALVMDGVGQMLEVSYNLKKGKVENIEAKPTDVVPIIADEDLPAHVAGELRSMAESAMRGEKISRTQVREVAQLLDKDEDYWLSDVIEKTENVATKSEWFKMYEANQEQIRTSLYGRIREIEKPIPSTKFAKIAPSKLGNFEEELKEAVGVLCKFAHQLVDECSKMVFDQKRDEFFSAICESLNVEAQAVASLLGKAEKLMRTEDMERMAVAHDRLAERAKVMAVVAEYIKNRTQPDDNEE